jgi:hypothetical protein
MSFTMHLRCPICGTAFPCDQGESTETWGDVSPFDLAIGQVTITGDFAPGGLREHINAHGVPALLEAQTKKGRAEIEWRTGQVGAAEKLLAELATPPGSR